MVLMMMLVVEVGLILQGRTRLVRVPYLAYRYQLVSNWPKSSPPK